MSGFKPTHNGHDESYICASGHAHNKNRGFGEHIHAGARCCSKCGSVITTNSGAAKSSDPEKNEKESGEDPPSGDDTLPCCCADECTDKGNSGKQINTHSDSCTDHSDGCSCSCCSDWDVLNDAEETEAADGRFKKEIFFLSSVGAVFAAVLTAGNISEQLASGYTTPALLFVLYLLVGVSVLKTMFRALSKGELFNEFTLMGVATIAAIAIGEMSEAVGVMLFYRIGEAFQEKAASKSRKSIKALLVQKPVSARIVKDGKTVQAEPRDIVKGDTVQVLPGEIIPIDGTVINGTSQVDTSPITGESMPVTAAEGDKVSGGTLALDGMLLIEASGPFEDSTIARVLEMIQHAVSHKSPTERFITRFAKWYTPAVFALAAATAAVPLFTGQGSYSDWIYRGLVMLVISCPCALVISIPLGYFGGIGNASKRGILVKGANVFDALSSVNTAVFDKTGTLTYGRFAVSQVNPAPGVSEKDLTDMAALAEAGSTHPIAKAILGEAGDALLPQNAAVTQIAGKGMLYSHEGQVIAAGSAVLMSDYGVDVPEEKGTGTFVHVVKNGKYQGSIVVSDSVRDDSREAVQKLRDFGVRNIYMLSGDREESVRHVAEELGIDGYRFGLMPDGKVEALNEICGGDTKKALFVGDGVNDGPVLVTSETGIAMGAFGSQVAIEAADAVILDDSPLKVADLMHIAKKTRAIVWQNIFIAMGVKGMFLIFGAAGMADLWEAVFADVGVALIAILNSTRTLNA